MDRPETMKGTGEAAAAAIRAGDQSAFTAIVERHRAELLVHCYRMLGSFDDAEDAIQDAFLRAWRYRESLKEGAPLRPWLYRVATNTCLDAIARDPRRSALARIAGEEGGSSRLGPSEVTWLQPFPDQALEAAARCEPDPEVLVLTLESIELAFLTVIQLLTPQQRAALILRDLLGWSAKEAADLLGTSVAAANSALQRARATLRARLPSRRPERPSGVEASAEERALLRRYVDAAEQQDVAALESLIREDAVFRMPPEPMITAGRDAILRLWVDAGFGSERFGRVRCATTRANRQPAVAFYVLRDGETRYRALTLVVLRIEEGRVAEIVNFVPEVFAAFGLAPTLESTAGPTEILMTRQEAKTEALRRAYAALNRNDIPAAVSAFDPQIEWIEPAEYPEGGTYRGHARVKEHLAQSRGRWAEGRCEPERFVVAGDRIIVFVHVRVRLTHETEWREARLADVYTFRDGKAIQMRAFADRQQALEWAGVAASDAS